MMWLFVVVVLLSNFSYGMESSASSSKGEPNRESQEHRDSNDAFLNDAALAEAVMRALNPSGLDYEPVDDRFSPNSYSYSFSELPERMICTDPNRVISRYDARLFQTETFGRIFTGFRP